MMNAPIKVVISVLVLILSISCSKNKRIEKKLEGTWSVKSALDGSGNFSASDFIGMELEFEKCSGNDKCNGELKNIPMYKTSCATCTYTSGGYTYTTGEFCSNYTAVSDAIDTYESYGYDCEFSSGANGIGDVFTYFEYETGNKGRELELSLYASNGLVIWFGEIEELTTRELKINFYTSYGDYYNFEFQKK